MHGTEVGEEALRINRAKGIAMRPAPVRAEDYEPGAFDVVTAFEVVEHVADPPAESRSLARILRPGGLFYCTTPNFDSASRRLLGPAWSVIDYPEHLGYFTTATLRAWLEAAGFATVGVTTTGVSPRRVLAGLRRTSAKEAGQAGGVASDDERARAAIEASRALRVAKRAANGALTRARAGDTLKGRFVLRDRRSSERVGVALRHRCHYDRRVNRFSPSRMLRAVAPLIVLAALLPAAASGQTPGVGGYATAAPATGAGTEVPGPAALGPPRPRAAPSPTPRSRHRRPRPPRPPRPPSPLRRRASCRSPGCRSP